jgi:hypothetical protein
MGNPNRADGPCSANVARARLNVSPSSRRAKGRVRDFPTGAASCGFGGFQLRCWFSRKGAAVSRSLNGLRCRPEAGQSLGKCLLDLIDECVLLIEGGRLVYVPDALQPQAGADVSLVAPGFSEVLVEWLA